MTVKKPDTHFQPLPKDYKSTVKPVWCPGCGHFAVLNAITKALSALELAQENVALISGIGCSSRVPAYTSVYGFHGVHGRALPLATGLKAMRPDLTVIVAGGDGDGFSIGGNHFLHACRRNADITYVVMDNEVYGMTKGQASPTTAADWGEGKMTPGGTGIRPFQPAHIALAAGATFVARGFSGKPNDLAQMLAEAIQHPGFSFVQVLSPCPTFRPEQMEWKHAVRPADTTHLRSDDPVETARFLQQDDGMTAGVFYVSERLAWRSRLEASGTVHDIEQELAV